MSKNELVPNTKYPPGSAMSELPSDKMRAFVENLFELAKIKPGHGLPTDAAKAAGYKASTPHVLANIARNLKRDPRVQAAILEMTKLHLRELGPTAIAGLTNIISSPHNSLQLKAILAVIDRIDPAVQKVEVKTEVVDQTAETLKYLDHLLSLGTPREVLEREFGKFGLDYYSKLLAEKKATEPKLIDAEFTVLSPARESEPQSVSEQSKQEELDDLL